MNILIIGSNNPMVFELEPILRKLNYNVFHISSTRQTSKNTCKIDLSKNLNKNLLVKKILLIKNKKFECVINFSTIGSNYSDDINLIHKNLLIYKNLTEILKIVDFVKLVNISSIYVRDIYLKKIKSDRDTYYSISKLISEIIFFHEFKHKTLINLRFPQIISDRYNRKGVLNSLYYDLNKYNNINITSNPNRKVTYINIQEAIKLILKYLDNKNSKNINIKGISVSLRKYAIELKKIYGDKNTKINFS